jgi:hypothetical protein
MGKLCSAALPFATVLLAAVLFFVYFQDLGTKSSSMDELLALRDTGLALDARLDRIHELREFRLDVIRKYRSGDITLRQAMEQFRSVADEDRVTWNATRDFYPNRSDDVVLAHQMIVAASGTIERDEDIPFLRNFIRDLQACVGGELVVPRAVQWRLQRAHISERAGRHGST